MTISSPHLSVAALKGMSVSQFFGIRKGMTLTTCCVCSLPLEDAQSVTDGVGPVCSRKYGYHTHVPTQEAIQASLGHLALLPIAAELETMEFLLSATKDERKFANILVAYCSHLPIAGEYVVKFTPTTNAPNFWKLGRYYGFVSSKSLLKGIGTGNRYLVDAKNLELLLWAIAGTGHGGTARLYNCGSILTLPTQSALPVPSGVAAYKARFARPSRPTVSTTSPTPSSIGLKITKKNGKNGAFFTVALPPFWNMGFWKPNKADQRAFWDVMKNDFKASCRPFWNAQYKNWVVKGSNEAGMVDALTRHLGYTRQQLGL